MGAALAVIGIMYADARMLAAILGALIVLDAVVPIPGSTASWADERFTRLVRRRRLARLAAAARGRDAALWVLDDEHGWASVAEHRPLGVRSVPVASIVGTVEPEKARAFDAAFRPSAATRDRWRSVWMAQVRGEPMPPIDVYRVGDRHVVRDGHHRVSVARDLRMTELDADVVELLHPEARMP